MFSIYPPFFYGAFNAVIAFVTLVVLGLLHVFCVVDKKVGERSFFSILYFIYHLLITVWILVGLILAYSWSNRIYQ
jgi:fumarate reductase subunit D